MVTRRGLLAGAAIGGVAVVAWRLGASPSNAAPEGPFEVSYSQAEWRERLTPDQYRILRDHGTERAGTSPLNDEKREGVYACAGCGQELFSSRAKYDSRTGWPSFWEPLDGAVGTSVDNSWMMTRTEVHCGRCGGHLGHIFEDGPQPTGLRYCINGLALAFVPA